MSGLIIPDLRQGSIIFKDPNGFHDAKFLITVVCEIYKNKEGVTHRGLVWKVFQNTTHSPIIEVLGHREGGNWEIVRQPELFMNGDFQVFENQIKEVCESLDYELTMELKFGRDTCQVSKEYLAEHKLGRTNVPWMELAKYYREGRPITRAEFEDVSKRSSAPTGFSEDYYSESPNSRLDRSASPHSREELEEAAKAVEILQLDKE